MTGRRTILLATLTLLPAAPVIAREAYAYGPRPDWTKYRQIGEVAVRAELPDAQAWAVEWPNGYAPFVWYHKGKHPGYATCGILRRSDGAEVRRPVRNFAVVIDHDAVKKVHIAGRYSNDIVNLVCNDLVARGTLPPSRFMEAATTAPQDMAVTSLGLRIRAMPEGAYVVAVEPGSSAGRFGIAPGTVVTHVNGIALAGMDAAMARVLDSGAPLLTLDTAAGGRIVIGRDLP